MKIIRFILKLFFVFILFMLGVSAADKEYLSQQIIGVRIVGCNDPALVDALYAEYDADIDSFCASIQSIGVPGIQVNSSKRFFEQTIMGDMIIPAGVYDTVCVEMDSNADNTMEFLMVTESAGSCFRLTAEFPYSQLQDSYIWFLSTLGKSEKILLNLTDVL